MSKRPYLVDAANFIRATRDSGYRGVAYALAEFVDNSLQAGAQRVRIDIRSSGDQEHPIELTIVDDGGGMAPDVLGRALAFGGSSRFGDRSSLGRYGMGLPNGALSCSRHVEVFTWRDKRVFTTQLDVDDIVATGRRTLPPVREVEWPAFLPRTRHGTAVRLTRCDRLEYRRSSSLAARLSNDLGRIYRTFLAGTLELSINGKAVEVRDPMFLRGAQGSRGKARLFGDELRYELETDAGTGAVTVRFAELPVERWHLLSVEEKRKLGITNAPCVSIMRAEREIDRGWHFMGGKRRENYDDWWRCEIRFDPTLDDLFGITHGKQGISPRRDLLDVLQPDLEPIARALNSRVRRRFEVIKASRALTEAERQAARADGALPRLPRRSRQLPDGVDDSAWGTSSAGSQAPYRIVVADLATHVAFDFAQRGDQIVLIFNAGHPLYRDLYGPLAASDSDDDREVAKRLALAVLAAARAEAGGKRVSYRQETEEFRRLWADVLATFFNA